MPAKESEFEITYRSHSLKHGNWSERDIKWEKSEGVVVIFS